MRAEPFGLGQFVPHDLAWQVRIEWFAPALASRVGGDRRAGHILARGRVGRRCKCLCFVEQAELVGMARLARCTEQFVLVGPQLLFGQIALGHHESKLTAQRIAFGE
ncbi:hypothetical protein BamMEX5DRAFT_6862 [Burkholderia ambifaria MEX-5]|uniref:Uncharacterized protein n=1 Tax=Burkholderia ambifaria MEX-5 TaxID=396597 RepID=B1TGE6_9BURK|nr:hypothetical protein BamMEX5DRAFT_6862 [Burkholderia ambifaria MEX-5]